MKKIGIFGGTFNPVHNGHLNLLKQLDSQLALDEILLIPDRIPPHKQAEDLVSGKHRLKMLQIAAEGMENVAVCDIELKSKGKSYSIFTLEKLVKMMPGCAFYFLMGADMLFTFDQWFRWQDILKLCTLAASSRNEGEHQRLLEKAETLGGNVIVLKTDPFPVSSTEIREKLKSGEDVSALLPERVLSYIRANGLYR